ncbi:MAG: metallopeptidase family protein [Rhodospirillaceae bacterium]|nr:metallopeptidase family protein [Rhodospirillaceae bacterium]
MISPPSLDDIEALAAEALTVLPQRLRQFTTALVIRVAEFPDDDVMAEMGLESPFDILGLYQGIAMDEEQVEHSGNLPNMVFLYRRPILDYWCETGEDLAHVVRHVLIHEIGHHFGFSDAEMEALEAEAEAEAEAEERARD